jgi:hypothetical protein
MDRLVEQLRLHSPQKLGACPGSALHTLGLLAVEAADTIEALTAECDELREYVRAFSIFPGAES